MTPGQDLVTGNHGRLTIRKNEFSIFAPDGHGVDAIVKNKNGELITKAVMQTDGNLVVYGATGNILWSSGTAGHPGAWLFMQDDGNAVIYSTPYPTAKNPIWSSNSYGWTTIHKSGNIFTNVVKDVEKIPVVGSVVKIVGDAASAPVNLVTSIASGERIDHALVDNFKEQLRTVKEVAPYAATVVSFVPGIGSGVAAAIGAGAALAEGQSITAAAKAAIRDAIPGGSIAAAGFDAATKIASGENVGKAALESARNLIPPGAGQKAFDIGLAVVTGEKIQTALANGLVSLAPGQLQTVLAAGASAIKSTPGLADVVKNLEPAATEGATLAAGLLSHSGVNEKSLTAVRSTLPPEVVQGFDATLKTQVPHIAWLANVVSAPVPTTPSRPAPKPPMMTEPTKAPAPAPKPPMMTEPIKRAAPAPVAPAKPPMMTEPTKTTPVRGPYAPYPQLSGAVHGLAGCGPECHSLGDPIANMGSEMRRAGMSAVHGSRGQPRLVHGPDGRNYLFAIHNGVLSARECHS